MRRKIYKTTSGKVRNLLLVLHFSTPRRRGGNVGIALAISKRCGNSGKPALGFPLFPQRGISTALLGLSSPYPSTQLMRPTTLLMQRLGHECRMSTVKPAQHYWPVIYLEQFLLHLQKSHCLPRQDLSEKRSFAFPFQAPLLGYPSQMHSTGILQFR